jgi:hypothetical protein
MLTRRVIRPEYVFDRIGGLMRYLETPPQRHVRGTSGNKRHHRHIKIIMVIITSRLSLHTP